MRGPEVYRSLFALWALAAVPAFAADYEVGPGKTLAEPGEVPWESLMPGDRVLIHHRPAPYRAKWLLNRMGPITVTGVPDSATGELPTITGENAVTRSQLSWSNPEHGIICIAPSSVPADGPVENITIERLRLIGVRIGKTFTHSNGANLPWDTGSAGIRISKGHGITVRNCIFEDLELAIYAGGASLTEDVTIERNRFLRNGSSASQNSNLRLELIRPTVQFNDLGAPVAGADAENIRDASAGLTLRYNTIAGGNRLVLFDAPSALKSRPEFRAAHIYGNVIAKAVGGDNKAMFGMNTEGGDRRFNVYHNTILINRPTNLVNIYDPSAVDGESQVTFVNNIVFSASNEPIRLIGDVRDGGGPVSHGGNWYPRGIDLTSEARITVLDGGNRVGTSVGFVDLAAGDYHLAPGSEAIDRGMPLPAGFPFPLFEYTADGGVPRRQALTDPPDIGAFEAPEGASSPDAGADGGAADGLVGWKPQCQASPSLWPVTGLFLLSMRLLRKRPRGMAPSARAFRQAP